MPRPCLCALLLSLAVPALSAAGMFGIASVSALLGLAGHTAPIALVVVPFLPPLAAGWLWAARSRLPESFLARWLPLVLPPLLAALALSWHYRVDPDEACWGGGASVLVMLFGLPGGAGYLGFFLGVALGLRKREAALRRGAGLARLLLVVSVFGLLTGLNLHAVISRTFYTDAHTDRSDTWDDLAPFSEGNRLPRPATPPSLRIAANHPRLTGTEDIRLLYAALAQAVYVEFDPLLMEEFISCYENADQAISALADGEEDMVFCPEPDAETLRTLSAPGSPLEVTPLARAALVVVVHRDNPLSGLTLAQLRDIYSGKITRWCEIGGPDADILPFQHAADDAAQTFLREHILNGLSPLPPLREETFPQGSRMQVADYRNLPSSLGFDFLTRLRLRFSPDEVRLLTVDGSTPTDENIREGSWPFSLTYVLLTRRSSSAETRALRDWLLGPEGRDLITRCGLAPLSR